MPSVTAIPLDSRSFSDSPLLAIVGELNAAKDQAFRMMLANVVCV